MNSEDQLLNELIRKRTDAIKVLYEQHAPSLLSLCLRYCGNVEDAEDVMHDGFIKIIKNLHTFKPRDNGSFTGWMKRIMVNSSLNHLRARSKDKRFTDIDPIVEKITITEEEETDSPINPEKYSKELIMNMICELPAGYRAVFNMYVFEEYTHREIAGIMNFTENTSKSQLSKARAMLKKKLNQLTIKQTT
jgi:RNA polymerase sigma-70 factor (ECF subfamily)